MGQGPPRYDHCKTVITPADAQLYRKKEKQNPRTPHVKTAVSSAIATLLFHVPPTFQSHFRPARARDWDRVCFKSPTP